MNKAIPIVIAVAAGAFASFYRTGCNKKGFNPEKVKLVQFERETFKIQLPDWKVEATSNRATGAHKVVHTTKEAATVTWKPGTKRTLEEVKSDLTVVTLMPNFKVIENGSTARDGNFQADVTATITEGDKSAGAYFSESQCTKTDVAIGVQVLAKTTKAATALGRRIEQSLVCVGDAPSEAALALSPSSSFGDGWGYGVTGELQAIGHTDGRLGLILQAPGNMLPNFKAQPQTMLKMFAALMTSGIDKSGDYRTIRGLGAVEIGAIPAKEIEGPPSTLGVMFCKKEMTSFLIYLNDQPEALAAFGCPNVGKSVAELPNGCKMGISDLCLEEPAAPADDATTPAEAPTE